MSNYTKTTNFTAKDSLSHGDPAKVVKGADLDTEFSNIATACNSKADSASPTLTGTVTIPTPAIGDNSTAAASTAFVREMVPSGVIFPYGGSAAPTGWLLCDGSAVNRTTYASLFTAISIAYGAGDGSTTFNVPDFRGRSLIGAGSGTQAETYTGVTSSGSALYEIAVTSNTDKWVTGMPVTLSGVSGFTGLTNGSYWIIRQDATHISFASSLANAQNGTPVVVTGTGNVTITYNLTARSLGAIGGEEAHAMSSTELLAHSHSGVVVSSGGTLYAGGSQIALQTGATSSTGGNQAMNTMQPYGVATFIIKT